MNRLRRAVVSSSEIRSHATHAHSSKPIAGNREAPLYSATDQDRTQFGCTWYEQERRNRLEEPLQYELLE